MNRKIMAVLIALVLVFCVVFSASAENNTSKMRHIENAVKQANHEIEKAVKKAQKSKVDDVDKCLAEINAIVAETKAYVASMGLNVEIVCDMETVLIDGRWVEIDPLRVINIGSDGGSGNNNGNGNGNGK